MTRIFTLTLIGAAVVGSIALHHQRSLAPHYTPRHAVATDQNYRGAFEWLNLMRANEASGVVDPMDHMRMAKAVAAFNRTEAKEATYNWVEMGPDNVGGRVRAICVDPTNHQKLWAGSVSGGLFRSLDGANTWTRIESFTQNLMISSIAILGNGHLYVATGCTWEGISGNGGSGFVGAGLFRSDDDGASFSQALAPPSPWSPGVDWAVINRIKADPVNPNRLYIAAQDPGARVYDESTGVASTVGDLSSILATYDVEVSADGNTILFAAGSGDAYLSTNGGTTFDKLDGTPSGTPGVGFPLSVGRVELAMSPDDPNYMYALGCTGGGAMAGVWASTDRGMTWYQIWPPGATVPSLDIFRDNRQGFYDNAIAVRPGHREEVWIGGVELWKTTLSGQPNQLAVADASPGCFFCVHSDVHEIVFADDQTAYIGCDGGIFKSPTGGQNFYAANRDLAITQFYSVAYNTRGHVIGGAQDNGSQFINGYGNSTNEASDLTGGDGFDVDMSQMDTNIMFTSIYAGAIFRSNDQGNNFGEFYDDNVPVDPNATLGDGLGDFYTNFRIFENPNDANSPYVKRLVYSIGAGDTIFPGESRSIGFLGTVTSVTQYGQYTNTGADPIIGPWTSDTLEFVDRLTSIFAAGYTDAQGVWVTRQALDFNANPAWAKVVTNAGGNVNCLEWSRDGNNLFYGTSQGEIFRVSGFATAYSISELSVDSAEYALTTTQIYSGSNAVTGLAPDPSNIDRLVATFGNYGGNSKVRRTENATGAATWTNIWNVPTALQGMPCYDAVIHKDNSNIILVGTEFGVWATDDGGATWTNQTSGIQGVPVFAMRQQTWNWQNNPVGPDWVQNPNVIYAGTHGRGFFRTESLVGVRPVNDPLANVELDQVVLMPNPASTQSVINFTLRKSGDVTVNVYDIKGKLVLSNTRRNLAAAVQNIPINTEALNSGTYMVEVRTGDQRRSARLVVMR